MSDSIFTEEQAKALDNSVNSKLHPQFTDEQAQALDNNIALKTKPNSFLPNTSYVLPPVFTDRQRKNLNLSRNLFKEANADDPVLPDNPTEDDVLAYDSALKKKNEAKAILGFMNYNDIFRQQGSKKLEEFEQFAREFGSRYAGVTQEDLERMYSKKCLDEWKEVVDIYGNPPERLLGDEQFARNIDPLSYAYLATANNVQNHSGFWGQVGRADSEAKELRRLAVKYKNGDIDKTEYEASMQFVQSRYGIYNPFVDLQDENKKKDALNSSAIGLLKYDNDGDFTHDYIGAMSNIYAPIQEHPVRAVLGLGGALAGGAVASLFSPVAGSVVFNTILSGTIWGMDMKEQFDAEYLYEAQSHNPNESRLDILERGNLTTTVSASALVAGEVATLGIAKFAKPFMALTSSVEKSIFKTAGRLGATGAKGTTKELSENLARTQALQSRLSDVSKKVLFGKASLDFMSKLGQGTAVGAGTMGLQNAINTYGVQVNEVGSDSSKALDMAIEKGVEAAKSSTPVAAAMSAMFIAPRYIGRAGHILIGTSQMHDTVNTAIAGEVANHSPMVSRDPSTLNEITDKVLLSRVYVDRDGANRTLNNLGMSPSALGKEFEKAFGKAQRGESISLSMGEFQKLPQEVKDEFYDYATNYEGKPIPEMLRAMISDEKYEELRKDFEQYTIKEQTLRDKADVIEGEVNKQLFENSKNTDVSHNSAISRTVSSFLMAMSETTGVDIEELWNNYKLRYKNYERTNLGTPENIDLKDVAGQYNSFSREVGLNERSAFYDVFHETGHWFLATARDIAYDTQSAKVKAMFEPLLDWAGVTERDITRLSPDEFDRLQEKFVAGFVISLMDRRNNNPVFREFSKFLTNLSNTSLFDKYNRDGSLSMKRFVEKNYPYNDVLPALNTQFDSFVSTIFKGDTLKEMQEQSYPFSVILDQIDTTSLPEKDRIELEKLISDCKDEVDKTFDYRTMQLALQQLAVGSDINKVINEILSAAQHTFGNTADATKYVEKVKRISSELNAKADKLVDETLKDKQFIELQKIKKQYKFDISHTNLSPESIETLKRNKLLAPQGTVGVEINDVINSLSPEILSELKRLAQEDNISIEEVFICNLCLTKTDIKNIFMSKLVKEAQNNFKFDNRKTVNVISETIAKAHKRVASLLLKHFDKARPKKRGNPTERQIVRDIESAAQRSVNDTRYYEADANSYLGLARKANMKALECTTKGIIDDEIGGKKGAITHLRNEYYQNSKAQYVSRQKTYIDNKILKLKNFVTRDPNKLRESYDTDIVALMNAVMERSGLIKTKSRLDMSSLQEIRDAIVDKDASMEQVLDDLLADIDKSYQFATSWQNQKISDIIELIDRLESLKVKAREQREFVLEGRHLSYEQAKQESLLNLAKEKDKRPAIEQTQTGSSATRNQMTFMQKVAAIKNDYMSFIKVVEQQCQQIDGKNFGGAFHSFYQACKDGEVNFKLEANKMVARVQSKINRIKKIESKPIECLELKLKGKGVNGKNWILGSGEFKGKTTFEILGIMLHMGTNYRMFLKQNLADDISITERVTIEGDRLNKSKKQIAADIEREQFINKDKLFNQWFNRMIKEGHITEEMLDVCEEIWQINAELEPKLQAAARRIKGYMFKREQPRTLIVEINGKQREIEAGYIPALLNEDIQNGKYEKILDLNSVLNHTQNVNNFQKPGFLEERNIKRDTPLSCDPIQLIGQTRDVIKYAEVMPAIYQFERFLRDPILKDTLEAKRPGAYDNIFQPWLQSLATMRNTTNDGNMYALTKIISAMTRRTGQIMMFGNIKNIIEQVSNVPVVIQKVGTVNFMRGLWTYMSNAVGNYRGIKAESDFMRVRLEERTDGMNEIFSAVVFDPKMFESGVEKTKAYVARLGRFQDNIGMIGQKIFQNVLDPIAYLAGKEKAKQMGLTPEEQVKYAEMCVRQSNGSFDIADTPKISKSHPFVKALTMFGTYFYQMYGLAETSVNLAFKAEGVSTPRKYLGAMMGVSFAIVIPSLIAELVNGAVGTGDLLTDDGNDVDWWQSNYTWAPTRMFTGAFPFVNKLASAAIDQIQGKNFLSTAKNATPILTLGSSFWDATMGHIIDPKKKMKGNEVRAILNSVGVVLHCPEFGFVSRPLSAWWDNSHGYTKPKNYYDKTRHYFTGTASQEAKDRGHK